MEVRETCAVRGANFAIQRQSRSAVAGPPGSGRDCNAQVLQSEPWAVLQRLFSLRCGPEADASEGFLFVGKGADQVSL